MSSSESEDENLKKFAESVDVTVFSNNLYSQTETTKKEEPKVELKSQRNLDNEENIFHSEINVSSTMQQFIGKKLSKLIEDQVEFVDTKVENCVDETEAVDNLRLLSGTELTVKHINEPDFIDNRKKVPIKRRKVGKEPETTESKKVQEAAIDADDITNEVKQWKEKSKREPIEFKNIKGICHIREPTNEFTKKRNQNNWSEAKIKVAKFHNPPICEIIKK